MVNGFSGIFMVASVEAVSAAKRTRRDNQRNPYELNQRKDAGGLFAEILEDSAKKAERTVTDCTTTTYGRDSRMQTFLYRTREYHY